MGEAVVIQVPGTTSADPGVTARIVASETVVEAVVVVGCACARSSANSPRAAMNARIAGAPRTEATRTENRAGSIVAGTASSETVRANQMVSGAAKMSRATAG